MRRRAAVLLLGLGVLMIVAQSAVAGTVRLHGPVFDVRAADGLAYFTSDESGTPDARDELWATDGSRAGTRKLAVIPRVPGTYGLFLLHAVGDSVFFDADGLWRSSGTRSGTVRLADLGDGRVGETAAGGGVLYFTVFDRALSLSRDGCGGAVACVAPGALWRSDGTRAGTFPFGSVSRNARCNFDCQLASPGNLLGVVGGSVVFRSLTPDGTHLDLWASDGTPSGTTPLGTLPLPFYDQLAAVVNGAVVFGIGSQADGGRAVLRTDGTPAGTFPLADLPVAVAEPTSFAKAGRRLILLVGGHHAGVWLMDQRGAPPAPLGLVPCCDLQAATVDRGVFFFAQENFPRRSGVLFRTDGTVRGTAEVTSLSTARELTGANGYAYFVGPARDRRVDAVWRSDGTAGGTRPASDVVLAGRLTNMDETLFFTGQLGDEPESLFALSQPCRPSLDAVRLTRCRLNRLTRAARCLAADDEPMLDLTRRRIAAARRLLARADEAGRPRKAASLLRRTDATLAPLQRRFEDEGPDGTPTPCAARIARLLRSARAGL